jgi:hypothetical protein
MARYDDTIVDRFLEPWNRQADSVIGPTRSSGSPRLKWRAAAAPRRWSWIA